MCERERDSEADLSRGFDAPDETEKDDKPGQSQTAENRETNLSKVPNTIRDVQHIVPEKEREGEREGTFQFIW